METRTIAIDLANDVFELAVAEGPRIIERKRLSRRQFVLFMHRQQPARIVMEACGSAHHWGRLFTALGHRCRLLPTQYVAPYRRRNKTDRTDVEGNNRGIIGDGPRF